MKKCEKSHRNFTCPLCGNVGFNPEKDGEMTCPVCDQTFTGEELAEYTRAPARAAGKEDGGGMFLQNLITFIHDFIAQQHR